MEDRTRRSIPQILAENHFRIKKHLGQNFLGDRNILDKIVRAAGIAPTTGVIEVGPGLGSLTFPLAQAAKKVLAYEIDPELVPVLRSTLAGVANVQVENRDVLDVDIDADIALHLADCEEVVVVANLPYYVTTPILMRFLETSKRIRRLVLMMQEEVARRVTSAPSTKDYNALTVAIRYRAEARYLFRVPRTAFVPEPHVDSAVVLLEVAPVPALPAVDEELFFAVVHRCFSQRRKTILNNLRDSFTQFGRSDWERFLRESGIDPGCRAETLGLAEFVRLADRLDGIPEFRKEGGT